MNNKRKLSTMPEAFSANKRARTELSTMPEASSANKKVRMKMTSVAITPIPRLSRKRLATTLSFSTPDRFIPNRSAMSTVRARASVVQKSSQQPTKTLLESHYDRHLRQVLFGTNEEDAPLLRFNGPRSSKRARLSPSSLFVESHNPYRHDDVLRPTTNDAMTIDRNRQKSSRRPQRISLAFIRALNAQRLVPGTWNKLGQGQEFLAVALGETIYLWKEGSDADALASFNTGEVLSCVQWSEDGTLLAIGARGAVFVFDLRRTGPEKKQPVFQSFEHMGHVTAIAWNGLEFVAACSYGLTRYSLLCPAGSIQATYAGHARNQINSLQWSGNTIASCCYATGEIKLWDSQQRGQTLRVKAKATMKHAGVQTLEINPRQPNILVSTGEGGLKFWNLWVGKLRAEIAVPNASRTLCSTVRDEILVAHGNCLSLWTLGPRVEKVMEHSCIGHDNITGLVRSLNGDLVCAHDCETLSFHEFRREIPKEKARAITMSVGLLDTMPTLR